MRELSAEGVDTCFLKGKNSLINAACPYREGSLAEHWWTRGVAYSELERVVASNAETERGQREWVGLTDEECKILFLEAAELRRLGVLTISLMLL